MEPLHIVKIGGDVTENESLLDDFLQAFTAEPGHKILVHGGGKSATAIAEKLGISQTLIDGRRITDGASLDVAVMVYAGSINKRIVAKLQALRINALGCTGADGNLVKSIRRAASSVDFGFVGDIAPGGVNIPQLRLLLESGFIPVFCAITHDGNGQLLNTNADTMAAGIAMALTEMYHVSLTYCFGKKGVLRNVNEESSVLPHLDPVGYQQLKAEGVIAAGMLPKLDNAFAALSGGVQKVTICHAANLHTGTVLSDITETVDPL
jgi:acetylglutamate kinase